MKIPTLRLFGVKTSKNIIKITCICKDNTKPEQIYHYFTK